MGPRAKAAAGTPQFSPAAAADNDTNVDGAVVSWTVVWARTTTRGAEGVAAGVARAEALVGRRPCRLASLTAT